MKHENIHQLGMARNEKEAFDKTKAHNEEQRNTMVKHENIHQLGMTRNEKEAQAGEILATLVDLIDDCFSLLVKVI